jgi:hypothetical protein
MAQTATTGNGHTHITTQGETNLTRLINSSNPTQAFSLPIAGTHSHTITLTQSDVDTLRGGGQITGKTSSSTAGHTHAYAISCG